MAKNRGKNKEKPSKSNKPDTDLQAGPRSSNSTELNYRSVGTLDPSRLASAFMQADQGYITEQASLFELVEEQDAHIFSELGKRRRSVTGLGWQLEPPKDATQAEITRTEELTDMIQSIPRFEDAHYDITDAIGKGFSPLEIGWKTGNEWVPSALHWVPQRNFQIVRETGELQYVKNGNPEALRPWSWIVHEHRAKSGYIEQAALFRVLAWTYAYKAYNVRDMQRFLEMYGLPLRLGKYPAGIGATQRDELLRAVRNIGNDGAGVVPSTMTIDFIQAMKSGTIDDFLNSIEYWERKQSLAILGGTLTSQADGKTSTNALGVIHDKVRREIMLHDVRQIAPTLTEQLIKPIALFNGMFAEDRMPRWKYDSEETVDQKEMVEVLDKAVGIGLEIDIDWAHKAMQIPRADGKAKLLGKAKPANTPPDAGAAMTRLAALMKEKSGDPDITAAYTAQLAALSAPFEQELIQKIYAAVDEAGDFDGAIEALEALAIEYKAPGWAELMALGMTASNLAGRDSV